MLDHTVGEIRAASPRTRVLAAGRLAPPADAVWHNFQVSPLSTEATASPALEQHATARASCLTGSAWRGISTPGRLIARNGRTTWVSSWREVQTRRESAERTSARFPVRRRAVMICRDGWSRCCAIRPRRCSRRLACARAASTARLPCMVWPRDRSVISTSISGLLCIWRSGSWSRISRWFSRAWMPIVFVIAR